MDAIKKTVTFQDGSIGEVVATEHGSLIVRCPDRTYTCVDVDEAGCVIPVEEGSERYQILRLKHHLWDDGQTFTEVLDKITAAVGDKDWPYPMYVVLAVEQEMEAKKKAEATLAEWKRMGEELVQAFDMRLVNGTVTYSCPPDFRWDAFDHMVALLKQHS